MTWRDFFSLSFRNLTEDQQVQKILENLDYIYSLSPEYMKPDQRGYMTTIYLRWIGCGCDLSVVDELTGEVIQIDTHGNGCLYERFPINEDLSDKALKRRRKREALKDNSGFLSLEETSFG